MSGTNWPGFLLFSFLLSLTSSSQGWAPAGKGSQECCQELTESREGKQQVIESWRGQERQAEFVGSSLGSCLSLNHSGVLVPSPPTLSQNSLWREKVGKET